LYLSRNVGDEPFIGLRKYLGKVFKRLAIQKESRIIKGHLMPDHVRMLILIPQKYGVSQMIGYIKRKSAIHLAHVYGEKKRNFVGQHYWARDTLCQRWDMMKR
jgi:putative transposase